eukprot:TRINITY_DN5793_c0_g1_i1.p1 TRINITY_DN5793_c0_g1~~TRINITY_DN5793_c0_g1_i1.p1  ORF type:complete len:526 (+),score=150.92 TRINITY_DN5793_c0_g1_i1:117-1580(+)
MADREEKVVQLSEITALEPAAARQVLEAANWDVETAIALHFAGGADAIGAPAADGSLVGGGYGGGGFDTGLGGGYGPAVSSSAGAGTSRRKRPTEPDSDSEGERAAAAPPAEEGWFSSFGRTASSLTRSVFGVASDDFDDWFETRFGRPVPQFSKEAYHDAVKTALDDKKLIVIWFFQDEGAATESLCKEVLQSPLVLRLMRRSFVLWAGDVSRFEPAQMARLLNVAVFPSLVVLQPLRSGFEAGGFVFEWPLGSFAQPVYRLSPDQAGGSISADHAIAVLTSCAEDHFDGTQMVQEEAERRSRRLAEERQLREAQDREFEESLLMDQIAAVSKQEDAAATGASAAGAGVDPEAQRRAEEAAAAKEAAEQAAKAAAEAEAAEAAKEEKRKERGKAILEQAEPAPNGKSTGKLVLKLPSGERLQRVFLATQRLDEVYDWADCCRSSPTPSKFELCTSFPTKALTDRSETLEAAGLCPSAALVMKSLDD